MVSFRMPSELSRESAARLWHPIASAADLPPRHVYHGQLLGRELAVWRADDGHVNVWENRCLHRGVRLSIGINDGAELKCQYHGWRYANRSAGCTYIPAHPADAPARTITNRTFPAVERFGLVWTSETPEAELPQIAGDDFTAGLALRPVVVNAPAALVLAGLANHAFQPSANLLGQGASMSAQDAGPYGVQLTASSGDNRTMAVFFVQPIEAGVSAIRGVLEHVPDDRLAVLLHHNERLKALRDRLETEALAQAAPDPFVPVLARVTPELAEMPELGRGRAAALRVRVKRKWPTAEGIMAIELMGLGRHLPTFQPGAHIDVHLPNGLIRQYSITNGPGELTSYVIAVKREPNSAGGSQALHETVREGDVLAISEPRNNFPLRRDALNTIFIAGGIGITPLLSMARALAKSNLPFELHYFTQGPEHLAFQAELVAFADRLKPHLGLDAAGTIAMLQTILATPGFARHVYVCGPGPMLEAARQVAAQAGWPEEAVHYEYFKNTQPIDQSSQFEIALARSAVTLHVPSGRSIIEVLRENGIDQPTSCEQGACGTCLTGVLEGIPDHQDVYLSPREKARNDCMMTCVSRAKTARLVLDL